MCMGAEFSAVMIAVIIAIVALIGRLIVIVLKRRGYDDGYGQDRYVPKVMACPDCGWMVSVNADRCPHCGRVLESPRERAQSAWSRAIMIFLAVVLGIVVAVWIISKVFHLEITGMITPILK